MRMKTLYQSARAVLGVAVCSFALQASAGIRVLVAGAEPAAGISDVVAKITASGALGVGATIDTLDLRSVTPGLAQLKSYDAVLFFTDYACSDPITFGNNLADYVDAGGNAVEMVFATHNDTYGVHGRWESAGYSAFIHSGYQAGASQTLGTRVIPSHPILRGVGSFSGGSSSWQFTGGIAANAYLIASWSNGVPMIATRHDKAGHIAGLNFFPVSSDVYSNNWTAAGNAGGMMMGNTLAFISNHQTDVLVLGTDASWTPEVRSTLRAFGRIGGTIDMFDISAGTPSLATLKNYDSVLVYTDVGAQNPSLLGDTLANYIDAGGGVVMAAFTGLSGDNIAGRFQSGGYSPVVLGSFSSGTALTLGPVALPAHPIMAGVTSYKGGSSSYYCQVGVASGATLIASLSNNYPLVVARDDFAGRVAMVNIFPPSSTSRGDFWDRTTDGAALFGNALKYAARRDNDVLIIGDNGLPNTQADIKAKLTGTGLISGRIDLFDYSAATPSLSLLRKYDSVLLYTNFGPADPAALGDVLAYYVNSGGGVLTQYGASLAGYGPTGLWLSNGYSPLAPAGADSGTELTIGNRDLPRHPVLNRVYTFDGGTGSFHSVGGLRPGSVAIAEYSDGSMLAAERSTKSGRVVELNYFPSSGDVIAGLWLSSTDGARMMANSLNYVARSDISVLIAGAVGGDGISFPDIQSKLGTVGRTAGRMDTFDTQVATPALGLVSAYDVVLLFDNYPPANSTALGNVMADYNDMGYGVVQQTFGNDNDFGVFGRWDIQGYSPFAYAAGPSYIHLVLGTVENPASPVMTGVTAFDNGVGGYLDATTISSGANRISDLNNGYPLAAEKKVSNRQVVALNFFPPSSDAFSSSWNRSTDGGLLMSNALTYVSTTRPCPADFNNDGFVDIFDFNDFVTAFESGDPSADFNGDGFVDFFDFNDFVTAFETGC